MKRALVNSNVWVALGAAGLTFATDVLAGINLQWQLYALVFSATLITYNLQRLASAEKRQALNFPGNSEWINANKAYIYISSAVAIAVCFYGYFHLNDWQKTALVLLSVVSVLYALPVIPTPKGWIRLRDFGITKPIVLGITWGLVTAGLPLLGMGDNRQLPPSNHHEALLVISRCLMMIGICIPFDIKDMAFDRATMAYPTLPIKFGVKPTLIIATIFSMTGFTAFAFWWLRSAWGWPVLLAVLISLIIELWLINRTKENSPNWYYGFVLDGLMILHSILLVSTVGLSILILLATNPSLD